MKHSMSKALWGILFIALAAIIILEGTGILPNEADTFGIILLGIGAIMAIHSLYEITFPGFYTGIAIVYYELSRMIDLPFVPVKILIIAVILLSIGTSLLIPSSLKYSIRERRMKKYKIGYQYNDENAAYEDPDRIGKYQQVENRDSENFAYCKNTFGATSKYISLNDLQGATLDCKFGELKAYFDGSVITNPPIDITVHCSFGSIELYVPKSWKINPIANVSLGNIEEKNKNVNADGPVVNLMGSVSFGSVFIIYV